MADENVGTEEVPEEVADFGLEHLSDTAREPFVGEIVYAQYPCNCEDCQKGDDAIMAREGRATSQKRLHIKIRPLDGTYDKEQPEWYARAKTLMSSWGQFMVQMDKLGVMPELKQRGAPALIGKVFRWEYREISVGVGDKTTHVWLPVAIAEKPAEESSSPDYS